MANDRPSAGWYPNPTNPLEKKYWNGFQWTNDIQGLANAMPEFRSYLNGASVDFGTAITEAIKNTFKYDGRASRSAYWWMQLFVGLVYVVFILGAGFLGAASGTADGANAAAGLINLIIIPLYLGAFLVLLSLTMRRLHDIDKSGWWYLVALVPLLGIVLIVFVCTAGTPGPNRYDIRD